MKKLLLLACLIPLMAPAQNSNKDSTRLLHSQKQDSLKRQKKTADSLLNHKDTSWRTDNWVPDLDDKKKKPAPKK